MNLAQFDLNLLLSFDAIYRHQSLSLAAQELDLTQPAVSAALKRMRAHLGNPLFVRTSRGMRPTPFADAMAPKVTHVLQVLAGLGKPEEFTPATSDIHYRLYINDIGMIVTMPKVMRYLREHAPRARLTMVDLRPDEVVEALDNGEIDLAVGYFFGMPNWAHQQTLRDTRFVCMVRRDHPDIGDTLTLDQFLRARHALYATSGSMHYGVEQALARLNLTRDVALTVPRFSALPFLVAQTDLLVTVPEDLGELFTGLLEVKLLTLPLPQPGFQIKQYWHERLHAAPAHRWLRQAMLEITAGMGGAGRKAAAQGAGRNRRAIIPPP